MSKLLRLPNHVKLHFPMVWEMSSASVVAFTCTDGTQMEGAVVKKYRRHGKLYIIADFGKNAVAVAKARDEISKRIDEVILFGSGSSDIKHNGSIVATIHTARWKEGAK